MEKYNIVLDKVKSPSIDNCYPIELTTQTMHERKDKVLNAMIQNSLDTLIIYADLEHGSNFEYLVGFLPRFEEALLVLNRDGGCYLIMGNENIGKVKYSRISAIGIHTPLFSLPNQPMTNELLLEDIFRKTGICQSTQVGVVGWKLFTSRLLENNNTFDIPHYIIESLKNITTHLINATNLFIDPSTGVRVVNNANEIAHYEFGASLASDNILKTMNQLEIGMSEMTLGSHLNRYGQRNSVVTIAAAGERFENGNLYPSAKKVKSGDKVALTVGYKGGLSSRAGYAVSKKEELSNETENYLEELAIPYFKATVAWLEHLHCGMNGNDMYQLINKVLPKDQFHWSLCPGHLCADEEWLSSPIYEKSHHIMQSGMIFQLDIIPSVSPYGGVSAESTVILANKELKEEIKHQYPDMWKRMMKRRKYITEELNIHLHDDILPLASTLGYLRPYFLDKEKALKVLNND